MKTNRNFLNFYPTTKLNSVAKKIILAVLVLCVVLMLWLQHKGYSNSISWSVTTEAEVTPFPALEIDAPLMRHQIMSERYLLKETYFGNEIEFSSDISNWLFVLSWLGICLVLAGSSYLKRFAFFAVMALLALLVNRLNLQVIGIFGIQEKWVLLLPFVALGAPLVIFNEYKKKTPFLLRLLILIAISSILFSGLNQQESPINFLASQSLFTFTIAGLIFLFAIAEELLFGVLYLVTKNRLDGNNHIHFMVFSLIYLLNLTFYFLNKWAIFPNGFYFYQPYILLAISCIIALFTLKFKATHVASIFQKDYFIITVVGLGIIFLSTLSNSLFRGNDAIFESYEMFIFYIHFGAGLFFLLYVIFNFIDPLAKGLPIYKIVYQEQNFPYLSARLAALAVALGLYFYQNQMAYRLLKGGYYNYQGDYELISKKDYALATEYYKQAEFLAFQSHYSNYRQGWEHLKKKDLYQSKMYFSDATNRFPSPYAYVNYAELEKVQSRNKALARLAHGAVKFENSGEILNNLGILYSEAGNVKKAQECFDKAKASSSWNDAPSINSWYLESKYGSIQNEKNNYDGKNYGVLANSFASKNAQLALNWSGFEKAPALHQQAFLLNAVAVFPQDDDLETHILEMLSQSKDATYNERLRYALALFYYKNGEINKSFKTMDYLQSNSNAYDKAKYLNVMGKMALGQKAYMLADSYFNVALKNYKAATNGKLDALAGLGRYEEVAQRLREIVMADPTKTNYANSIIDRMESHYAEVNKEKVSSGKNLSGLSKNELKSIARKNAFDTKTVLSVVDKLEADKDDETYEIILEAMEINPFDVDILKKYILVCTASNLDNYAKESLNKLSGLMDKNAFNQFYAEYKELKQKKESEEW